MNVHPDALRQHIEYSVRADQRLLEGASASSESELTQDFGTADKSVPGTLQHIYLADLVWVERLHGTSRTTFPKAPASLEELRAELTSVAERWQQYAAGLNEAATDAPVHYRDLKGNAYSTPVWVIVQHVVNHAMLPITGGRLRDL